MSYPLISISLLVYNAERYIKECLDSILSQDYPNFEIIISDDASTDQTPCILKEYKDRFPAQIKLTLNLINVGITKNNNIILSQCRGKYIAFFAGDDVMLPGKITKQVEFLEQHPECSICYHNLEVFYDNKAKKSYLHHHAVKPREGDVIVSIKYGPFNAGSGSMVKRASIPANGFNEKLAIASDALFWIEILENGGQICYLNEVLARYRIHNNNVSRTQGLQIGHDFLIMQSILLIKYPQFSSYIIKNLSQNCFLLAKHSDQSLAYLKASFRIKKNIKASILIILYYLTLGKIKPYSSLGFRLNNWYTTLKLSINQCWQYILAFRMRR